jgi:uncharacterized protein
MTTTYDAKAEVAALAADAPVKFNENGKPHFRSVDSYQNFTARLGVNAGNQMSAGHYGFNPITRRRLELEWAFRGSWICKRVVQCIATDMTRAGVKIAGGTDLPDIARVEKHVEKLAVWPNTGRAVQWSRLYGGGLGYIMIDGQNPSTPLRVETIGKGQFKGIWPMDRWMVQPSLDNLVKELGNDLGKPMFYDTINDTNISGLGRVRIHYTRVVRLVGEELPYWQAITENLWGMSVYEPMWDRLLAFDSTTLGAAQLVFKAHLRSLKIPGLRDIIAAGGPGRAALTAMVEFMRETQSNEGISLIDGNDEFDTKQYTFSGLDKVLASFGEQLAGATETPLVRLFGQSPAGFSTGEAEIENYNEGTILPKQEAHLKTGMEVVYQVAFRSATGQTPPEDMEIEFNPLKAMNETDEAEIGSKLTTAIISAVDGQLVTRATGLKELKRVGQVAGGMWSSIEDSEIADAENDPPPTPEALGLVPPPPKAVPGSAPPGKGGANVRKTASGGR